MSEFTKEIESPIIRKLLADDLKAAHAKKQADAKRDNKRVDDKIRLDSLLFKREIRKINRLDDVWDVL